MGKHAKIRDYLLTLSSFKCVFIAQKVSTKYKKRISVSCLFNLASPSEFGKLGNERFFLKKMENQSSFGKLTCA